ncbi:protein sneaky [Hetaerina americana]|uniref:protein sneaky n=1 Tax=Hetaerina americana TaxID=62018 RepID=UPI003A7F340B
MTQYKWMAEILRANEMLFAATELAKMLGKLEKDGYSKKTYSWSRNCKQLFDCCSKFRIVKIFVGFKFGVLLGVGIHELVLADLDFGDSWSAWIGLILCLLLGVGNAVSAQIQCISLLTLPSICGRAGRSALKALVLTFILAGPIKNLTTNAHEVVRVFSCSTELTYNLTKTRFDLMYKPFQEALLNMKADSSEMKNTMKSIKKVINPLSTEIEDENELKKEEEENDYIDALQGNSKRSEEIELKYKTNQSDPEGKKYEKIYMKKLETRCEEVISHGTGRCHKMFMKAYDKCYDKVSVMAAWLLCWPMKLTFVCNIMDAMGGGAGVCDPKKEVEPGFGESFAAMKESEDLLEGKKGGMDDVKIKFEPIEFHPPLNFADAKEAALSLQEDFKSKKSTFDAVSRITRMLLSLIFLKVLLRSQEYHDKYIQDFSYDNYWITSYFRRIDARRHAHHKTTLLPLKKAERAELCYVTALIPLPHERKAVLLQFIKILLEAVTATVFILLDRLLSEILLIIRLHSKIDYTQAGKHDLTIKVKGTGMMARLVRSVLGGFNIKQEMHNKRSNLGCLPNPTLIKNSYLLKIYGTYFIVWILILLEAYTQRLRRMICSIYYKKIEKRRILFLYNETLKRRANYVKRLATKLRERFKEAKRSLHDMVHQPETHFASESASLPSGSLAPLYIINLMVVLYCDWLVFEKFFSIHCGTGNHYPS